VFIFYLTYYFAHLSAEFFDGGSFAVQSINVKNDAGFTKKM